MFWWNVDGLSRSLKAKVVSEREKSHYFLATLLLAVAFTLIYHILPQTCPTPQRHIIHIIGGLIYLGVTAWGIITNYRTNRTGDDRAFIERFVCLSLPIALRLTIYFLLIAIPIGILRAFLPLNYIWGTQINTASLNTSLMRSIGSYLSCSSNITGLMVMIGLKICYFLWIRAKIRYVSGAANQFNVIRYIFIERFRG